MRTYKRTFFILFLFIVALITIITVMTRVAREGPSDDDVLDAMLDPRANPNIRVGNFKEDEFGH